jgi:hypothetical protein
MTTDTEEAGMKGIITGFTIAGVISLLPFFPIVSATQTISTVETSMIMWVLLGIIMFVFTVFRKQIVGVGHPSYVYTAGIKGFVATLTISAIVTLFELAPVSVSNPSAGMILQPVYASIIIWIMAFIVMFIDSIWGDNL